MERIHTAIRHLEFLSQLKGERIAVKEMRKHIGWYMKGMKYSTEIRSKVNTISNRQELEEELYRYLNRILSDKDK